MKHYLKLVPISAKIHRKQSKMTRICITLAVLLVAVMFGLADMYLQGVTRHEMEESGNWHYEFHSIDTQTASFISAAVMEAVGLPLLSEHRRVMLRAVTLLAKSDVEYLPLISVFDFIMCILSNSLISSECMSITSPSRNSDSSVLSIIYLSSPSIVSILLYGLFYFNLISTE